MQSGVSLGIMDISGQRSGTDHISTRSAEDCQLLQTSISRPIKVCLLNTYVFVHCAPKILLKNFYYLLKLQFKDLIVLECNKITVTM